MVICAPTLEDWEANPDQSAEAITLLGANGPFSNLFCINIVTAWNTLFEIFGQTSAWLHGQPTYLEGEE
jgi:hypothetical protein